MGSRGASSGISNKGKKYGTEYHSVLTEGNIKFIKINEGSVKAPMETMTNGRVYVTLDNDDMPKYITYFDDNNKRKKQIDLTRPHMGVVPHTHNGYEHSENDGKKQFSKPTTKEKAMIDRVYKIWNNRESKE